MHHSDWFKLRYESTRDYPNRVHDIGSILDAFEFEGNTTLDKYPSINPKSYPDHFRKLRWWEHRTIEQLLTIKYAKVVSGSNYYGRGDVVEVIDFMYNNPTIVGGKDTPMFNLQGHHFVASQIEPATQKEHEEFWQKERAKLK